MEPGMKEWYNGDKKKTKMCQKWDKRGTKEGQKYWQSGDKVVTKWWQSGDKNSIKNISLNLYDFPSI